MGTQTKIIKKIPEYYQARDIDWMESRSAVAHDTEKYFESVLNS